MINKANNKDLISIEDLSRTNIDLIIELAEDIKRGKVKPSIDGKIIASCFFEASTRTRLSFESAILKIGGKVIGFSDSNNTSLGKKGESLEDTIKVINGYADALIIRHPEIGSAQKAAEVSDIPVINAGDGANQHPTQTLLDLFTIKETQGRLDNLKIVMIGDLKYGRTVHSLSIALMNYDNIELIFVSPETLKMPPKICDILAKSNIQYSFSSNLKSSIIDSDIIYMTRTQLERFSGDEEVSSFTLDESISTLLKPSTAILHPLPRISEISMSIDLLPQAKYFEQAKNGLFVRQAILSKLFV